MTGYGLAFPLNSKYKNKFNEQLLEYRENGDLERLGRSEMWCKSHISYLSYICRYWLHGVCKPNMQEKRASEPLSIDQVTKHQIIGSHGNFLKFLSAFLLLILGTICSLFLLVCEHVYVRYIRKAVTNTHNKRSKPNNSNCFSSLRKVL